MEALRRVRLEQPAAAPLAARDRNDQALIDDLPFAADLDMRDLGAVALLLGNRDNDLKGRDPNELDSLALIHGDPGGQREHCLRNPSDDEPTGTEAALRECRAFIREVFLDALEGLDGAGRPTLDARIDLAVGLSLRGKTKVPLPRFYVRIGQALHAMQDAFTHTYRTADRMRVSASLNYVDAVGRDYLGSRDGPKHSIELDKCDATDELRTQNRALAVEASGAVLTAALAAGDNIQKLAALDRVLNTYLGSEAGCSDSNGWCSAPEAAIQAAKGCGCTAGEGAAAGVWGLLGLAVFVARRGRRWAKGVAALGLALVLVVPGTAQAQVEPAPAPAPSPAADQPRAVEGAPAIDSRKAATTGTTVPITPDEVEAVQKEQARRDSYLSIYVAGAVSLYNAAGAGVLGVHFHFSEHVQLGLDAELNGWYGIHARQLRLGATNVYLSLIFRLPLKYEKINLRSNLQLGAAVQMFDLAGVPAGSIGVFGGINPLGVEYKLSRHLYLILYPLGFAIPITQLKGAPFGFPQFRTTLGVEVAF